MTEEQRNQLERAHRALDELYSFLRREKREDADKFHTPLAHCWSAREVVNDVLAGTPRKPNAHVRAEKDPQDWK